AKPAVDAFDHIDVVARGAARAVIAARPRLDGDRLRRTNRFAEFAGDTALLAVGIATQRVLAPKARREVPLLEPIVERGLGLEEIAHRQHERHRELLEKQRPSGLILFHGATLSGPGFRGRISVSPGPPRRASSRCPQTR